HTPMRIIGLLLMAALQASPAPAPPPPAPAPPPTRAVGSMSELMIKILYPTSDAVFYIESRTPANDVEWNELQAKALTLAESANLLMQVGRLRQRQRLRLQFVPFDVEWNELQAKALTLAESANLLMLPGYARDQERW